jgi:hypothetical protein
VRKLIGVELVRERRELPRDHPAYDLPQDRTTPEAIARAGEPIVLDYAVVYIELEGGVRIKLIEELAESMYDHYVTDSGIRRAYVQDAGVDLDIES